MVIVATIGSGCTGEGECVADGPPLIHLGGTTFTADLGAPPVTDDQIGDVVFVVAVDRTDAIASCDWQPAEGDSTLPVGTEFHSIERNGLRIQLAAMYDGEWLRFSP